MKKILKSKAGIVLMCLAVCLFVFASAVYAQNPFSWGRYYKPVLSHSTENNYWDSQFIENPSIVIDYDAPPNERYKMWYAGQNYWVTGARNGKRIGYATSTDGIHWTKFGENKCPTSVGGPGCVFDVGNEGSWDSSWVYAHEVHIDPTEADPNKRYKLWYSGVTEDQFHRIGYATSPDGKDWTRFEENYCPSSAGGDGCVLDLAPGQKILGAPTVIIDQEPVEPRYKLWYEGYTPHSIGYATSDNGINWDKYSGNNCPGVSDPGCVFDSGADGTWDDIIGRPIVVKDPNAPLDKIYKMWYTGWPVQPDFHIGYATSPNGINWVRNSGNYCPTSSGGDGCIFDISTNYWENKFVFDPFVIETDDRVIMWYVGTGVAPEDHKKIGYACSLKNMPLTDVAGHWAEDYINAIYCFKITAGYSDNTYRPENQVTHAEMAVFLIKVKHGESFTYSGTPYFNDVPAGHWAFKFVQRLYEDGITTGCGGDLYCPESNVTRAAMATFIIRALYGESFTYSGTPHFTDVSPSDWEFEYVQRLYEDGLATGYPGGTYRPEDVVTRAETAALLSRAFLGYDGFDTCSNLPVRIVGGSYYPTLQSAYNAAADGGIIQSQYGTFFEDLSAERDIAVTLDVGYDCGYTSKIGNARLRGDMTIGDGTITIGGFVLE